MLKSIQIFFSVLIIGAVAMTMRPSSTPTPPTAIEPYLNGLFVESTPGASGSWVVEDVLPDLNIASPLRIQHFPGSDDVMILCKLGEIWRVSLENQTKKLILDIKDRAFKKGEAGTVGMALHPKFGDASAPNKQEIFVFYRTKPQPDVWDEIGFNRLSKFSWNSTTETFDTDTEEILIQQYDRSSWHNGGGMFFGPDGMLYVALGDEGGDTHQAASTQRLDGGLFSGLIRIDINNDPNLSYPIRRQPVALAPPPAGWEDTYSQGYSIPNDNPWQDPSGSMLEEFYAIGLRSPYSTYYDKVTDKIWVADVGSNKREEISLIEKGDNLQWPFKEGTRTSDKHEKPTNLIGTEKPAYFEHKRSQFFCIIGGGIYRGSVFPSLQGKYIYADYTQKKLYALTEHENGEAPTSELLFSKLNSDVPLELSEEPGLSGVHLMENGEILLTIQDGVPTVFGKVLRLKKKTPAPEPPTKLSELGVFTSLEDLTPISGIIPYTVNAPLWSDRAIKKRWVAIPNDGTFDTSNEQITFYKNKNWKFPEGTVFIKHFEIPRTTKPEPNGEMIRLETRFFILGKNNQGYGLTYKWNEEGTDATLLGRGVSEDFDIYENGQVAYTQTWEYPGRDQCMTCHTENSGYILGVNTQQLNGNFLYTETGQTENQLNYFNRLGIFNHNIGNASNYPKSYYIGDESADLGLRVRSYLDANCASCHQLGGLPMIDMDVRFPIPLEYQNFVNLPTQSQTSDINRLIVKSGHHADSEIWVRSVSNVEGRMPPLGRSMIDEVYVNTLAKWIDQLSADAGAVLEFAIYPNPTGGWTNIRISDNWTAPFEATIFDARGQRIQQQIADSHAFSLNLTSLAAGVYFLEVKDGTDRQVQRIVVN